MTGNFNFDFFKKRQREKMCTVTTPYGLQVQNRKEPTRTSSDSKTRTLSDYLICEPCLLEKVFTCYTNLKSDHFGVVGVFYCYAKTKKPRLNHHVPLKKCFIRNNKNSFQLADKGLTRKT